jgi:hypothetical protein
VGSPQQPKPVDEQRPAPIRAARCEGSNLHNFMITNQLGQEPAGQTCTSGWGYGSSPLGHSSRITEAEADHSLGSRRLESFTEINGAAEMAASPLSPGPRSRIATQAHKPM